MNSLTTQRLADIANQRLAHMREAADRELLAAELMPGSTQAHACSKRIDDHLQRAYGIALLADICAEVGDKWNAERIHAQINTTVWALIDQSLAARLASAPKEVV